MPKIPSIPNIPVIPGYPIASYAATVLATTGLLSYWRLHETSGSTAADEKAAVTGTYVGTPTLGATGPLGGGQTSKAVDLNGSSQYVSLTGSPASLTLNRNFSIEAWIFADSFGANRIVVSHGTYEYAFAFDSSGNIKFSEAGVADIIVDDVAQSTGAWHHVAVTIDNASPANVILYVDGVEVASATTTRTLNNGGEDVLIGAEDDVGAGVVNFFDGKMCEVAIYSTALSAATVAAHYAQR